MDSRQWPPVSRSKFPTIPQAGQDQFTSFRILLGPGRGKELGENKAEKKWCRLGNRKHPGKQTNEEAAEKARARVWTHLMPD